MGKALILGGLGLLVAATNIAAQSPTRLERIRQRGTLGCGVEPSVPGFSEVDAAGTYRGLDIDICRALAAAVFGHPDKVTYVPAPSLATFVPNQDIDVVSRRLTWELRREAPLGLLFGPITFYDGQGFLVARALGATGVRQLSGRPICVAGGTVFESQVNAYFAANRLVLKKSIIESPHDYEALAAALRGGRCSAYTGDVSDLGAVRSKLANPSSFQILAERISREPLAPLVRQDDPQFFGILRWTIYALVNAEELGVTSKNAGAMRASANLDVQRLLGVVPGNGKALGLEDSWAYDAIVAVGNYGEIFERNLGASSRIKLDRGLNRLAKNGGLMYAPPLR